MSRWKLTAIVVAIVAAIGYVVSSTPTGESSNKIGGVEARELIAEGALFIDVRTPEEYDARHLEGAVNIPLSELSRRLDELGGIENAVVLYCRSGNRSHQAARLLESRGFEEVYDLGGYGNW